jgi:hypothetical protein
MLVAEVFSVFRYPTPSPFVSAIAFQAFETGLVFLSVMSLKDLLLCTTCGAVNALKLR